jgi:hypothetical protein
MARVSLTEVEREFIRERIARYELEAPAIAQSEARHASAHQALPLYFGWGETIGITSDGMLVHWGQDGARSDRREFEDPEWINIVLVQGARRYPSLAGLIPKRPSDARTCPACEGTGTPSGIANLPDGAFCRCAGLGWVTT